MTKQEIFDAFGGQLSKTGIVLRDGEYMLRGKWALIEYVGDKWDIFLCNHKDMRAGLPALKLTWLIKGISARLDEPITKLDGEAYLRVDTPGKVLAVADLCGLRRKRKLSEAHTKANTERLAKLRTRGAKSL